MKLPRSAWLAAIVVLLAAPEVRAQAPEAPESGFGGDLQVLTIPHVAFDPHNGSQDYFTSCCVGDSFRRMLSGANVLYAAIDSSRIPNGALIERIDFFVRDSDPAANAEIAGRLCRTWISEDGTQFNGDCSLEVVSAGAPGDMVLSISPNHTVRYDDFDGDGAPEAVFYELLVQFGVNSTPNYTANLKLRGARVLYRRQVSPAPASATFGDVPTSHPFYRFVEALAASGITAGCGGGDYCPDSAVTRGQMAVFLSKALGLHWPATPAP